MSNEKLPFKTYKAKKRPWDRFKRSQFDQLGQTPPPQPGEPHFPPPPPAPGRSAQAAPPPVPPRPAQAAPLQRPAVPPPPRAPASPRRKPRAARRPVLKFAKWFLIWVVSWLIISGVLFVISATIESGKISDATNAELGGGGNFVTSPGNVLILGLDKRPKGSKEPGADTVNARTDSMLLVRTGGGEAQRLSILRDSYASIPGYQPQKINAAYALGGAALTIRTVEQFLGVDVHHIVIIDFEKFPALIDALGGIDVTVKQRCIKSTFGGKTFKLTRGEHHLNGEQALRYARVRKNACNPSEDDRARAKRQQEVMSAIKSKAYSPMTFVRLPWVSWATPKAFLTDMSPVNLLSFLTSMSFGPDAKTTVLKPSGAGPGGSLIISDTDRAKAAGRFRD